MIRFSLLLAIVLFSAGCDRTGDGSAPDGSPPDAQDHEDEPRYEEPSQVSTPSPVAPVADESNEDLRARTDRVTLIDRLMIRGGSLGITLESTRNPEEPEFLSRLVLPGSVSGLTYVKSGVLAVGCGSEGIFLVNIARGNQPRVIKRFNTHGAVGRLNKMNRHTLVADGHAGVIIADFNDPQSPEVIGRWVSEGHVRDVRPFGNDQVVVAESRQGVTILGVSDPHNPTLLARHDTEGAARAVAVRDRLVFVADFHHGLVSVEASVDGREIEPLGHIETADSARDVVAFDNHVAVAMGNRGVLIVDTSDPRSMEEAHIHQTRGPAVGLHHSQDKLLIALDSSGAEILDLSTILQTDR